MLNPTDKFFARVTEITNDVVYFKCTYKDGSPAPDMEISINTFNADVTVKVDDELIITQWISISLPTDSEKSTFYKLKIADSIQNSINI